MPNKGAEINSVGLVMLAAGSSSRLGSAKQLITINGESLIRRMAQVALGTVCRPIVVVLGAQSDRIASEIADLPVLIAENPDWEEGMSSSIRLGVEQLIRIAPQTSAAVLMLCDQPLVSPDLINRMVAHCQKNSHRVVACEYGGQLGVPALFDRSLFDELRQLKGTSGAKKVIALYASTAHRIAFLEGELDIDTPQDYQRVLDHLEAGNRLNPD
jgi:molybdenum cofactor cytidylyltransferase